MKNKLIIFVFFLALAAGVVVLMLPPDRESVYSENRTPATLMPVTAENVKSGRLTSNFEEYLGDNLGFRSDFTSAAARIESQKGIDSDLGKIVSTNKDIGTSAVQKSSLLIVNDKVMEVFIKNRHAEEEYINAVNYFADELKGIKMYSMIIPTQLEFQEPVYANIEDSQKESIDYIYSKLSDGITAVNAYDMLKENKDGYIYFRTDHHWTAVGAYYGYCAFLKAASGDAGWKMNDDNGSKDPFALTDYENINIKYLKRNIIDNFRGYLYKQAQTPSLLTVPDKIEWFELNEDEKITVENSGMNNGKQVEYRGTLFDEDKDNYSVFMSGDQPLSVITNSRNPNGKTIMILKDSYANAFVPWLINNYRRIILIDPRNCENNLWDIISEYNPDECMIMNYIFTTTFEDYCGMMADLIK